MSITAKKIFAGQWMDEVNSVYYIFTTSFHKICKRENNRFQLNLSITCNKSIL